MLTTAAILFLIAAAGGLVMAGVRFATKHNPPAWLSMLHGLLAAAGLTLLLYAICTTPVPAIAWVAALLFLLAAAAGALMSLQYKWKQRLLPAWLVVAHAVVAVTAFVLLLVAAFG